MEVKFRDWLSKEVPPEEYTNLTPSKIGGIVRSLMNQGVDISRRYDKESQVMTTFISIIEGDTLPSEKLNRILTKTKNQFEEKNTTQTPSTPNIKLITDTTPKTKKQLILEGIEAGMSPKEISQIVECDLSYIYMVKKQIGLIGSANSAEPFAYEGPEGLKKMILEYNHAIKTINRIFNFILEENGDLKEQVKQFNSLLRGTRRPLFSPAVQKALVVYGE